jgi:hypothetical protein
VRVPRFRMDQTKELADLIEKKYPARWPVKRSIDERDYNTVNRGGYLDSFADVYTA